MDENSGEMYWCTKAVDILSRLGPLFEIWDELVH
jgi:hypothetical protein